MSIEIYHNPKCSKSRAALQLLQEKKIEPIIRFYLDNPPDAKELKKIISSLNIEAVDLLRKSEDIYKELVAKHGEPDNKLAIEWMVQYPKLIERPIVINGNEARIGRPTENILEIL